MSNNPFQPPKSGFNNPPPDRTPGSTIKAVLLGAATDIIGTMIFGFALGIVYAIVLAGQGLSDDEIQAAFQSMDRTSLVGVFGMAGGLAMSVLGGFVCARIANVHSYHAVGMTGIVSFVYGTFMGLNDDPWPTLLALNLTTLLAVFIGGWWHIRKLPRN